MPGPRNLRLVIGQLTPLDDLEAALLALVRGEIRGATLQRVTELLGGRPRTVPGALLERRLCPLDAEERVDRTAMLALWALAQPLAQVVQAQVTPRYAMRRGSGAIWTPHRVSPIG